MKKLLSGVRTPSNLTFNHNPDDKPVMIISRDRSYIEILGHRLHGDFSSFEDFMKYIKKIAAMEQENEKLKEEIRLLHNDKCRVIDYLETRIEECKIDRAYENGIALIGMRESIYQDILNRVEGKDK